MVLTHSFNFSLFFPPWVSKHISKPRVSVETRSKIPWQISLLLWGILAAKSPRPNFVKTVFPTLLGHFRYLLKIWSLFIRWLKLSCLYFHMVALLYSEPGHFRKWEKCLASMSFLYPKHRTLLCLNHTQKKGFALNVITVKLWYSSQKYSGRLL